jgi:hypothetical protein
VGALAGLDVTDEPSRSQVDDRKLVRPVQCHPRAVAAWRDREIVRLGLELDARRALATLDEVEPARGLVGDDEELAGRL